MTIAITELGKDSPLVVSPRRARYLLNVGNTRLYELLASGELDSFLDGRARKITMASIGQYIARQLSKNQLADRDRE